MPLPCAGQELSSKALEGLGVRELRRLVDQLGADGGWCLERGELLSVARRCVEVCAAGRPDAASLGFRV
jgi:hypothetical protein